MAISEDLVGERLYRTRVVAELEHDNVDGGQKPVLKGVLGLTIDVTDMKARAQLELDNTLLMMEEQAAKDSNRMKSQFLANVCVRIQLKISANEDLDVARDENPNGSKLVGLVRLKWS